LRKAQKTLVSCLCAGLVLCSAVPLRGASDQQREGCGPLALRVFCALRGRQSSYDQVARALGTDAEGNATLLQMKEALKELSFDPVCAVVSLEQLQRLPLPVILVIRPSGSLHYVVVARRKIDKRKVVLDPPQQEVELSQAFLASVGWEGIVLFDQSGLSVVELEPLTVLEDVAPILSESTAYMDDPSDAMARLPMQNKTRRTVRILSVRASCSRCLRSTAAFSYPSQLEPGEAAELVVHFDRGSVSTLGIVRIFLTTDNPLRPLAFCDIVGPGGMVRIFPRISYPGDHGREIDSVDITITSPRPLEVGAIRASLLQLSGKSVPTNLEILEKGQRDERTLYITCRVIFDIASLSQDQDLQSSYRIPGSPNGRLFSVSLSYGTTHLGEVGVFYEAPLTTSVSQLFFGDVSVGIETKVFLVTASSREAQLLSGEVRLGERGCAGTVNCAPLGEGRWQVTVSVDPKRAECHGIYNDVIVIPYIWNGTRCAIRLPIYVSFKE